MFGCAPFAVSRFGEGCPTLHVLPPPPPRPGQSITLGSLGCGHYDVFVLTRGGGELVVEIPMTGLTWGRILDDTSSASVTAAVLSPACSALVGTIRPWRHEVAIYRNGEQVWVGPLLVPKGGSGGLQLDARDLTAWWDHRLIHDNYATSEPVDLSVIFQAVADDAVAPENGMGLHVQAARSGVLGTAEIVANQFTVAGQQIRQLSSTGIDWTVIARRVLCGGQVVPVRPLPPLWDDHFVGQPDTSYDGTLQANRWIVSGGGSGADGEAVYAAAVDTVSRAEDGLLEYAESLQTVNDVTSAQAAAATRVALGRSVAVVENAVLSPSAPVTIDQLVPGALCPLRLSKTTFPVNGTYRLMSVQVTAGGDSEQVALAFQPEGTSG